MSTESPLAFFDHSRQSYAEVIPTPDAGEFMVGDYGPKDGERGVGELGEFTIGLRDLSGAAPHQVGLSPQLRVFGDGCRAMMMLAELCDGDLTRLLADVPDAHTFSKRLLALGLADYSDTPLEG